VNSKASIDRKDFNQSIELPYQLRIHDFETAMLDVYYFFADVNRLLSAKGLKRFDDMMRYIPASMAWK